MKRIYFTSIPLNTNFIIELKPLQTVGFTLKTDIKEYAYPIIPIIDATMREGDEAKIVVVRQTNSEFNPNYEKFRAELDSLNLERIDVIDVAVDENQGEDLLLGLYKRLLTYTENDGCYYADLTFGPKTLLISSEIFLSYWKMPKNCSRIPRLHQKY